MKTKILNFLIVLFVASIGGYAQNNLIKSVYQGEQISKQTNNANSFGKAINSNNSSYKKQDDIFTRYPWLDKYVDPNNCDGIKVTVINSFFGIELFVETPGELGYFLRNDRVSCTLREGEDNENVCPTYVALADLPVETWECGGYTTFNETIADVLTANSETRAFNIGTEGPNGDYLSTEGPYTVFAANDDAFLAVYPNANFFGFIELPSNYTATINNHVVEGAYLSTDLFDGQVLTSISGEMLLVTINNSGIFINDAQVITTDYETTNGVVHVIDKLLLIENIPGCNNAKALNFNPDATENDNSCIYAAVVGCLDSEAINYNPSASQDNGSCVYFEPVNTISTELYELFPWLNDIVSADNCSGATITIYYESEKPFLYVETAESKVLYYYDGTFWCEDQEHSIIGCRILYGLRNNTVIWNCGENTTSIVGCTDPEANNYNASATENDGSCNYENTTEPLQSAAVFEDFPWLRTLMDEMPCEGTRAMVYDNGSYEYVYMETEQGGTLYFEDGSRYCTNRANLNCREFYGLGEHTMIWECSDNSESEEQVSQEEIDMTTDTMFEQFSWLSSVVDRANCNNTNITTYSNGSFQYVYIKNADGGTLYSKDGTYYCADRSGLNCREFYGLTAAAENVWNCGDANVEEPIATTANLFNEFSWLSSVTDGLPCEGAKATVYNKGSFQYIYIETATGGTLYFEDGTKYCSSRAILNCKEFYGLEDEYATWLCADGNFVINNNSDFVSLKPTSNNNTKVKSIDDFEVRLYPNPTTNYLNIESLERDLAVTLYDVSGKIIETTNTTTNSQIDLSNQNKGIYILELRKGNNIKQHKVVKY